MQCSPMSIFHNIYQGLLDACYIWRKEMTQVVKDEGVLIFLIVVPLIYPLLEAWFHFAALVGFALLPWLVLKKIKNAMLTYVYIP